MLEHMIKYILNISSINYTIFFKYNRVDKCMDKNLRSFIFEMLDNMSHIIFILTDINAINRQQ